MNTKSFLSENFVAAENGFEGSLTPKKTLQVIVLDFLLLNISFFAVHWVKYDDLFLSPIHKKLLILFWALWFIILVFSNKRAKIKEASSGSALGAITRTNGAFIVSVSFAIVVLGMTEASRIQAYLPCLLFYALEMTSCAIFFIRYGSRTYSGSAIPSSKSKHGKTSRRLFTIGGVALFASFSMVIGLEKGAFFIGYEYIDFLLMVYGLWIVSSLSTNKYDMMNFLNKSVWLAANVKAMIVMTGGLAILVFGTRFFSPNRMLVFGPIFVYFILESIVFYLYFLYRKHGGNIKDIENFREIEKIIGANIDATQHQTEKIQRIVTDPVETKLRNALEFLNPSLFDFIKENMDLFGIDRAESVLASTDDLFNIKILDPGKTRLLINLHKLNDIRWLNQYFLAAHATLVQGGYLVGKVNTIETQRRYIEEKYSFFIGNFLYALHFIWKRVVPKLPWTKKLYFALTKGRSRTVSMTEVFGRLYFCGFRIVSERTMDNCLFFIAEKVKAPSVDENPTYGPIIRLKRHGLGNQPITVYKFRTMYPYSEYLQEYVYEKNRLEEGGKFKDDFRVTSWGRFLRRTWLDELPMLYNWLKGDLQLIGVRPLSKQYLSLYSAEIRQLRKKAKPGLLPPFYADLPRSLEEIQESEKKYIESYLKKPMLTQFIYFNKCVVNIIFKRARSA